MSEDFNSSPVELSIQHYTAMRDFAQTYRGDILMSLHQRTLIWFIEAQGFGDARLPGVRNGLAESLAATGPGSISLPVNLETASYLPHHDKFVGGNNYLSFHIAGLLDLIEPDRMGYVQNADQVMGFESHRMTRVPKLSRPLENDVSLKLNRLELVSLSKYETPVVYVSDQLPNLENLGRLDTRPLTKFEQTGLGALNSETEVIIDDHNDRIHMIGSVRARNDCLRCHKAEVGELLGAFTYEFQRTSLIEPSAAGSE